MTWQLATAKIYNGSTWVNAAGGSDVYAATDGADAPYTIATVTATASATPNTKGAWIEVIASTAITVDRLIVNLGSTFVAGTNSSCLLDIGTGAAGSETVICANLLSGYCGGLTYDIPIRVASGTRIAARIQSAVASKTQTVGVGLGRAASTLTVAPSTSVTVWGSNTANSQGVQVIPGANTKGSWSQITADSGNKKKWLAIGIQGNGNTAMQGVAHLIDIGIGAAGAETVIVPNIRITTSNSETYTYTSYYRTYFLSIPANSRLAVRSQAATASVTSAFYIDANLFGSDESGSL